MDTSRQFNLEDRVYSQVVGTNVLGLIVDMDDTVFWEIDFVNPFVSHLAKLIEPEIGRNRAEEFAQFFIHNWSIGSRKNLFQKSLTEFEVPNLAPEMFLEEMKTFRVGSGLRIRPWAERFFREASIPISILTNGNPDVQRNKYNQLKLPVPPTQIGLVCARDISSKPSPKAVELILESWQLEPRDVLFVGDSSIDELCARNSGCNFICSI